MRKKIRKMLTVRIEKNNCPSLLAGDTPYLYEYCPQKF